MVLHIFYLLVELHQTTLTWQLKPSCNKVDTHLLVKTMKSKEMITKRSEMKHRISEISQMCQYSWIIDKIRWNKLKVTICVEVGYIDPFFCLIQFYELAIYVENFINIRTTLTFSWKEKLIFLPTQQKHQI